jgi:hypothetical protein
LNLRLSGMSLAFLPGALTFGKTLAKTTGMPRIEKIPGANVLKESFGKYTYWRVWLGKKFTGGKPSKTNP